MIATRSPMAAMATATTVIAPDAWRFPSILSDSALLSTLLWLNGLLLINRLLQRGYFVTRYYGIIEGLLSAPRMMWSNFVNFFANLRALRQVLEMGDSRRVAWDKTTHEFPALTTPMREPLGQRLVAKGLISEAQLQDALTSPVRRRLGRELLLRGWVNSEQLVATLVRHDEQLKDLPIIMITSRSQDKHRDLAERAGINAYITKPYNESDLVKTIRNAVAAV